MSVPCSGFAVCFMNALNENGLMTQARLAEPLYVNGLENHPNKIQKAH